MYLQKWCLIQYCPLNFKGIYNKFIGTILHKTMFGVLKRKHGITSSKRVGIFKRAHDAERKMETQSLIAKQSLY
jgi:hypothetical protein